MKKLIAIIALLSISLIMLPSKSIAAGGVFASGGGKKQTGQTFTITVAASGADFDSLQGSISVSGPVDIVSFSAGGATWLPGKAPANGAQFVGICSPSSSLTVASIKLKAKSTGSGSVSVSGVKLARNGVVTGTGSGSASFTIERAPDLPDTITITSTTHPDQNVAYDATTIALAWNKEKGVDNFSYLLDQVENTVPAAKATDSNTAVTYADKAIGTYFFHIRAHNTDGWSSTTNFKINIKEPDAKIDETLPEPNGIEIREADIFTNSIADGTVSGIIISGTTEPGFSANIKLNPAPTLPEGKTLTTIADEQGRFTLLLDFPITAGFHVLTVQGQKDKILTPISDEIRFEISQVMGGKITILTDADTNKPAPVPTKKWYQKVESRNIAYYVSVSIIVLLLIAVGIITLLKRKKFNKLTKSIRN